MATLKNILSSRLLLSTLVHNTLVHSALVLGATASVHCSTVGAQDGLTEAAEIRTGDNANVPVWFFPEESGFNARESATAADEITTTVSTPRTIESRPRADVAMPRTFQPELIRPEFPNSNRCARPATPIRPVYTGSPVFLTPKRCVNRTGDGKIDQLAIANGAGPSRDANCDCWQCPHSMPFNLYGPGEFAGPARGQRMLEYRLRSGDNVELMFLVTQMKSNGSYRLVVGDEILVESESDKNITRGTLDKGLVIQPDGTVTLRLIGQVHASGQTLSQLRGVLEQKYKGYIADPNIDVTPVNTGTAARHIREAISGTAGFDPQRIDQTISPSGEIRLPRIGSVQAQGLTLEELKREINLRYDDCVGGLEVEPSLLSQAPHYVYVLGEVQQPGRFNLDNSPTTLLGAVAMAGGHVPGANLRQVVVFRRGENFELLSTLLDVRGAVLGRESNPRDEIWLRDGDVIILPSTPIRLINNLVRQVFTEGVYGVVPFNASYNFGESF